MRKRLIVQIGYQEYAVSPEDAIALLAIASRAMPVKRPQWNEPYEPTGEDAVFIEGANLAEVRLPALEKTDKYTSAAREVSNA